MNWYESISEKLEKNGLKFIVWTTIAILIGGLVEIPPFFFMAKAQNIKSVKPYNALELAGRDVYIQEGCSYCHTQMVRPFKWETDRWDKNRHYGTEPYSKAGEFVYDHPFLWGSKRTGPDLAHEGSLNNNPDWHKRHLMNPRDTSPNSIMPAYKWLFETQLDSQKIARRMNALKMIGVPYSESDVANADKLVTGKTEGDALVAYLLKLGKDTMTEN